jgi:hypothetical protein
MTFLPRWLSRGPAQNAYLFLSSSTDLKANQDEIDLKAI